MSESPERPRLTRRQLREMEQARQAAESAEAGAESVPPASEASGDFAVPPPSRPTMTRRQMREAAQREAEEARRAQEELAAQQQPQQPEPPAQQQPQEFQQQPQQRHEQPEPSQFPAEQQRQTHAAPSQINEPQPEVQIDFEAERAQPSQLQQPNLWEQAQNAPPPALETEDAPRIPEDRAAAQQAVASQREQHEQPQQQEPQRASVFPNRESSRPGFYPAPQNLATPEMQIPQTETPAQAQPTPEPTPDFSAAPNVRPPEGITAIRTVEETGELSPILHTSSGESVWPSIPGADESDSPAQPTVAPATPVPFRAPAWGARTTPVDDTQTGAGFAAGAAGVGGDSIADGDGADTSSATGPASDGVSGMSAAPSRWPVGGAAGAAAGVGIASGAPGGATTQSSAASGFPTVGSFKESPAAGAGETGFDDEDDEEYEPMFTWLRLLVLMIIAFVLGALVWILIGKSDAGAAAAAFSAVIGLKNPLGD